MFCICKNITEMSEDNSGSRTNLAERHDRALHGRLPPCREPKGPTKLKMSNKGKNTTSIKTGASAPNDRKKSKGEVIFITTMNILS